VLITGLFFTCLSLFILLLQIIFFTGVRDMMRDLCRERTKFFNGPPASEAVFSVARDRVKARYTAIIERAFKKKLGDKFLEKIR
jgi:hypothetical protein